MKLLTAKFFSRVATLTLVIFASLSIFFNTDIPYQYYLLLSILSFVIPLSSIILFKQFKITSDYSISVREERPKLFLVMAICFLLSLYVSILLENRTLIAMYTALNITFLLGFLITFVWKISFHMIWSITSIFFIIYLWKIPSLYLLLLLIPPIAWSRLELKRHTPLQVIAGILLTSLCIVLVLTLFKF